ncbi:hypothetical protein J6590_037452 [Homalodisca vitripennis]|nr:hypothetical protein J6590_037452 [Homalodisca vitripennis]
MSSIDSGTSGAIAPSLLRVRAQRYLLFVLTSLIHTKPGSTQLSARQPLLSLSRCGDNDWLARSGNVAWSRIATAYSSCRHYRTERAKVDAVVTSVRDR